MNYKLGLARLYLLVCVGWIGWGLYRPILDRQKRIDEVVELFGSSERDCMADLEKDEKTYEDYISTGGVREPEHINRYKQRLSSCSQYNRDANKLLQSIQRETVLDTYRETGYAKVVWFCLGPPFASLVALALGAWVVRGFRISKFIKVHFDKKRREISG